MRIDQVSDPLIFDTIEDVYDYVEASIGEHARVELDPGPLGLGGERRQRAISRMGRTITDRIVAVTLNGDAAGGALRTLRIHFQNAGYLEVEKKDLDLDQFRIYPQQEMDR
jgi:hypothetical protein